MALQSDTAVKKNRRKSNHANKAAPNSGKELSKLSFGSDDGLHPWGGFVSDLTSSGPSIILLAGSQQNDGRAE
ncbi:MAG: hypothetical protein ACKV2Q_32090 [Planctomycetaceae bacterium]